jgi:hypothetical protein
MPDTFHAEGDARSLERRRHPRRPVPFSWVQLADDNGGIVLDVSEGGLSVQAVRSLTDWELQHIRFQIGKNQAWIETRARIAWISASKNTAGLEFIELADEARDQTKHWFSSEPNSNESDEGIAFAKELEPIEEFPALLDPENAIPFPELETTEPDFGNPDQHAIPERAIEDQTSFENVLPYSERPNAATDVAGTVRADTGTLLAWSQLEARVDRELKARDRTGFSPRTNRFVGVAVISLLLLSALFFEGYHWHESKLNNANAAATAFVRSPEPSPVAPTGSTNQALVPTPPSEGPQFALQVVATTDKKAAEALAATLKRRYFPAFVYFRGTDSFYRVLVGPYGDSDSSLRTMKELKGEGFESFRTPWNPSAAQSSYTAPAP